MEQPLEDLTLLSLFSRLIAFYTIPHFTTKQPLTILNCKPVPYSDPQCITFWILLRLSFVKLLFLICQNFRECYELPNSECKEKFVPIPYQKKVHKKQCLLPDQNSFDSSDDSEL